MLFVVTVIWGATFPLIKNSLHLLTTSDFINLRFGLSTLILLPFIIPKLSKTTQPMITSGLILGALNFLGFYTQTLALKTQSSADAAFITGLYVVFVPLLNPVFKISGLCLKDITSAIIAFLGIVSITGIHMHHISSGHIQLLLSAVFFALAIIYLHKITKTIIDMLLLTFYQILFIFLLSLIYSGFTIHWHLINQNAIIAIIWCALFATCLSIWLQSYFQRYTTSNQAAIIYSFEPIFATLFAYFFNAEVLPLQVIIGGALIVMALLISMIPTYREV